MTKAKHRAVSLESYLSLGHNSAMGNSKKFLTSRLSRLSALGLSALKASAPLIRSKQIEAASELVEGLAKLRGAAMKVGQMLSVTEDLFLPKEISDIFKKLQKNASPMPGTDIDYVFNQAFRKPPHEIFREFDYTPIAQASIGQVHRGVTKEGHEVAIKVQYPEIRKAVVNDFKNLDFLDRALGKILSDKPDLTSLLDEVKLTLESECDYLLEAKSLEFARQVVFKDNPFIEIPQTYPQYSNEMVLTMEYMQGDDFEKTLSYSKQQKDQLGQILYDSFMEALYTHQFVHSDPQSGNFLFRPGKIVLLDFGSTKIISTEIVQTHIHLIQSLEKNNLDLYREEMIKLGFFFQDEEEIIKKHFEMIKELFYPYTRPGVFALEKSNPFEAGKKFMKNIKLSKRKIPYRDFFHLDRAQLGLYTKLKSWESSIDWLTSRQKEQQNFLKNLTP